MHHRELGVGKALVSRLTEGIEFVWENLMAESFADAKSIAAPLTKTSPAEAMSLAPGASACWRLLTGLRE